MVDSRAVRDGEAIRRRRLCESCGRRFTTYERVEITLPDVVKKDRSREPFDRAKVVAGIRKACEKRPVSLEDIDRFVQSLETELHESGAREVPSERIGERVMEFLRKTDPVAYVRFASVYREFGDPDEFLAELAALRDERRHRGEVARDVESETEEG